MGARPQSQELQQGEDYSVVGVCSGEDYTSQDPRTQVNSEELKAMVEEALKKETFAGFSGSFEGPHNNLHISMRCDMKQLETAAYNPLFYLHHTYIRGLRVCLLAGTPMSSRST